MKWKNGHITPWWRQDFKTLDYKYLPLTNGHDLERWYQEGYKNILNLNGELYNMSNPMPDYAEDFFTMFNWHDVGIAFYRMNTGDALPMHQDAFSSYKKMFNITDSSQLWRAVVFLEDWKSGHYFEIDSQPLMPWVAGDWVAWNYDVPHFAANIGIEPRYTMQITGHT